MPTGSTQVGGGSAPAPVAVPTLSTKAREVGALPSKKYSALKKGQTVCPICKKECHQFSKLVSHYATKHTYQGKYTCTIYFRTFSSQLILERHMPVHSKFKCFLPGHPAVKHGCPPPGEYCTKEEFKTHLMNNINYAAINPEHICEHCLLSFKGKNA